MDQETRSALAVDLASCHDEDVLDILERYGLGSPENDPESARLLADPRFQEEVRRETLRVLREQARVGAAHALVRSIPYVESIVTNETEPARDRIAGVSTLSRIAGVEIGTGPEGAGISISINIPDRPEPRTIGHEPA